MSLSKLQEQWSELYREELPRLAKERDRVQSNWPVFLDHCFARIILDIAVGIDQPWANVVKAPAVKNMTESQLRSAIELGRQIADGSADLKTLDEQSLSLRGKVKGGSASKRKLDSVQDSSEPQAQKKTKKGEMANVWAAFRVESTTSSQTPVDEDEQSKLENVRERIANDNGLTEFRKRVLTLLTQIPRGRYTSYKHLAEAAARTSPSVTPGMKVASSARAVGSAMRSNPFAPAAPCHRVLAADGKIGGFGGDWGEEGRFVNEKRSLLRSEGVRFDGKGKVIGAPFTAFH